MNPDQWPPRLLIVDVEGNGAQPPDLVEFAALPITAAQPDTGAAWSRLIRPPVPISPTAMGIHGITNQAVANAPAWPDVADRVHQFLDGAWIAAHNARVDYDALQRHLPGWQPAGVIDTLRLSRAVYGKATRHNLDALITHTKVDTSAIQGQRHRAATDAHLTALLLLHLADHYPTWDALAAVAVPPKLPGLPVPTDDSEGTLW